MSKILLIALGGGTGAVLRYGITGLTQRLVTTTFPVGTLFVNVLGCFVIGLLTAAFAGPLLLREEYRAALLIGVLGGFTTFSTFGYETFALANDGQWSRAGVNIVASNGLCLVAVWLGYRLSEKWFGA